MFKGYWKIHALHKQEPSMEKTILFVIWMFIGAIYIQIWSFLHPVTPEEVCRAIWVINNDGRYYDVSSGACISWKKDGTSWVAVEYIFR